MKSSKCPKCGLINFAAAEVCKRCGSIVTVSVPVPEDGFVQSLKSESYTRGQEIGIGIFFFACGVILFAVNWYEALAMEKFSPKSTIIAPISTFIGLMLFIFPYPEKEKFPDHDLIPKGWALFILIGAILGFWNYYYFMS